MRNQKPEVQNLDIMWAAAEDNEHPVYNFACGNKDTLENDKIVSDLKEFYDRFYVRSEVVIVTIGDNKYLDLISIKKQIQDAEAKGKMPVKRQPENEFIPLRTPKMTEDILIFTDTERIPGMMMQSYLPISSHADLESLVFLMSLASRELADGLIKEKKLITGMDKGIENHKTFAGLVFAFNFTNEGTSFPAQVIADVFDVFKKIESQLTAENFEKIKQELYTSNFLSSPDEDEAKLADAISNNYREYGISRIFSGGSKLTVFDQTRCRRMLKNLQSLNWMMLLSGPFDKDPNANNNILSIFQKSPYKNDHFGTLKTAESVYKLNQKSKYGFDFTSMRLKRELTQKLLNSYVRATAVLEAKPSIYSENMYLPSREYLEELKSFKPSMKVANIPTSLPMSKDNLIDTYDLPLVTMNVLLNFDMPADKKTHLLSLYYSTIINMRLLYLNLLTGAYRGSIFLEVESNGIVLKVQGFPGMIKKILVDALPKILETKSTKTERLNALTWLLNEKTKQTDAFEQAFAKFKEYIRPYISNLEDLQTFLKEEQANGFKTFEEMPKVFLSYSYVERSNDNILGEDLLSLMKSFDQKKSGFTEVSSKTLEPNTLIVKNALMTTGDSNDKGYVSCIELGKDNGENNALSKTIEKLISPVAFEKLRTEKRLGYVVIAQAIKTDKSDFICLIIQSELLADEIHKEAENFWTLAESELEKTSEAGLTDVINSLKEINEKPFLSRGDSTEFYFSSLYLGTSEKYFDQTVEKLSVITKNELVDFYKGKKPKLVSIVEKPN